ncbi:hypothetical protein GH5_04384 [Leishmania sp. Ghana 2012 LV757]|uniref:hypothetical protein n=1 Tax=Leishmania sp. Ghana 2012 LV757 TaxID=2803181 RepID=UPI001B744C15|nr:hypothetical protein GH5_04384 [Leishmania sp. Ghana 2012 LV757]
MNSAPQQQRPVSVTAPLQPKSPPPPSLPAPDAAAAAAHPVVEVKAGRRSFVAQVTSTISSSFRFLANEASVRRPGMPRLRSHSSNSCVGKIGSRADEPPLTHARPPASREEVEEQLDKILCAIRQLQQLQQRGRYIASAEVKNIRLAFLFAVGERQRYSDAAAARKSGRACSSAPTTPSLSVQHTPLKPTSAATAAPWDVPGSSSVDGSRGKPSLEAAEMSPPIEGKRQYSPKAEAADRLLTALEKYVDATPSSTSFDAHGARFSWRSVFRTPSERRLQSLVVSLFTFFTGIPICFAMMGLLLLSRYTAPFVVLYVIWIFTLGRPNHPQSKSVWFTRLFLWRYYGDYFPIRLVIAEPVRRRFHKERNYFFVYHPHGIHSFGAIVNFGLDQNDLPKMLSGITIHLQTLAINLYVPIWRQLAIWGGCGDASASCIRKTLRSGPGQSIMLVVGGAEESLLAKPNRNDLLLFKRKGFIKIALQEGTPLVPVYGFGENNVYSVPELADEPLIRYLMALCKQCVGFVIPLVRGRGFFNFSYGLLPHRRPIVVVVGEPLEVPRIPNPTKEDLELWQGKYIECLRKLYNDHRGIYDLESTGLRIIR